MGMMIAYFNKIKVALLFDCDLTRFKYTNLLTNLDLNIDVFNFCCGQQFLKDLYSGKIKVPDIVFTDYTIGLIDASVLIKQLDMFKTRKQIYSKLFVYLVSDNFNVTNFIEDCASSYCFKSCIIKPLLLEHISAIYNKMNT